MKLARNIGFAAVDAGLLHNARLLEPFGILNIQLGYALNIGTQKRIQISARRLAK